MTPSAVASSPAASDGLPPTGRSSSASAPAGPVTLLFAGDVLWHPPLLASVQADARAHGVPGYNFAPLWAAARPAIAGADLAVCNQETPIVAAGEPIAGFPAFGVPPETAPALAQLGFDACTTASNHTLDKGVHGIDTTLAALDAAGVAHTGSSRAPDGAPALINEVRGVKVAIVAGTWELNGDDAEVGRRVGSIAPASMIERAKAARAQGARIVVAAVHAGTEYTDRPNRQQVDTMEALAASGEFDLLIGHHSHTVQPWTKLHGVWTVYSLGNFVAHMKSTDPRAMEGVLARFTFVPDAAGRYRVERASYVPLMVTKATADAPARVLRVSAPDAAGAPAATIAMARSRIGQTVRALGAEPVEG